MSQAYTIQSNARRAARKAGVDPSSVYCVPEGWKFPDPEPVLAHEPSGVSGIGKTETVKAPDIERIETVAAEPAVVDLTEAIAAIKRGEFTDLPPLGDSRRPARKPKTAKPVKPAKAKPAAKPRGKRDGVCDRVIAAIRARWTSVDELMKLSGWQRHTLRGYISTRAGKDGFTVERRKVDGVSQYRVAA